MRVALPEEDRRDLLTDLDGHLAVPLLDQLEDRLRRRLDQRHDVGKAGPHPGREIRKRQRLVTNEAQEVELEPACRALPLAELGRQAVRADLALADEGEARLLREAQ